LTKSERGSLTQVRFHPSRIHHGFRVLGREASADETEVLRSFLEAAGQVRIDLALEPGDYLLVNNRMTLHDRTRCSLELGRNGIHSRVTHIAFVQELAPA
jgi:alpha-ketoglutarate-dependent taurine dioxygenase